MKRSIDQLRTIAAKTIRLAVATSLLVGTAFLLRRPAPQSGASAPGGFSHMPSAEALADGFETKDLSARGLAYVLAALGGSAALLIGIVFFMIWLFSGWNAQDAAGLTPEQMATLSPPAPQLQIHATDDLRRLRARELHALAGYAWIDANHTRAHIPIERAMALVAGHSLDEVP